MKLSQCSIRILFYSLWIAISVIQASFTELFHDEAYYWMYSKNLDWGYFDHPPIIAFVVKLGYLFFQNELGVRLFIIILNAATIFLIEEIVKPKNLVLFYAIIASIVLIHYGGILAIPDIPLLFFTASFFYIYKIYSEKPSWLFMILLGVNSALLILSKYHGILVIGFTLLSNLRLLRKASTWVAIIIAMIIFLPHVLWQYEHHFPTLTYQLFNRSETGFNIAHLLEYVFTQPLIYGPIIGFILLFYAFRAKPENTFEQALKFTFVGVFILFLILSFRGKVEAHWTDVTFVSLIYFGYKGILESVKWKRFIYVSLPISLFIIFLVRIFLIWDFTPANWKIRTEFHGWDEWAKQIDEVSGEKPVVFTNSYQHASKFGFYSGNQSISMSDASAYRLNQFDIWESEKNLQGESIMVISNYNFAGHDSIQTLKGTIYYSHKDEFRTYPEVTINTMQDFIHANNSDSIELKIGFAGESHHKENKASLFEPGVNLFAVFFKRNRHINSSQTKLIISDDLKKNDSVHKVVVIPPDTGNLSMYFAISNDTTPFRFHSSKIKLKIE